MLHRVRPSECVGAVPEHVGVPYVFQYAAVSSGIPSFPNVGLLILVHTALGVGGDPVLAHLSRAS